MLHWRSTKGHTRSSALDFSASSMTTRTHLSSPDKARHWACCLAACRSRSRGGAGGVGLCRSAPGALRVSFASGSCKGRAMKKNITVVLLLVLAAGCSSRPQDGADAPAMDPGRKVSEQDCSRPFDTEGRNLLCREVTAAERRARIAEEERQARARKEAEERAARERLERERAEQLAREEAARKERAAEEARLAAARAAEEARLAAARAAEEERAAAERRRLEAEAARKAQEERERQEKAEAEARARQRAEQEAREARQRAEQEAREVAERECRRLEQERLDGRALLANFVANYGKVEENKGIAGQITAFLDKARKVKPCPPAKAQRAALSGVDGVRAPSPTTNFAFGLRASFVS